MNKYYLINGLEKEEKIEDVVNELLLVEDISWDEDLKATKEMISFRIKNYPKGLYRLKDNSGILSYLYFIILDKDYILKSKTWFKITNNGKTDSHNIQGDSIFGVTLGRKSSGYGKIVLEETIKDIRKNKSFESIENIFLCGRIPSLHLYYDSDVSVQDLDEKTVLRDRTINMFRHAGFEIYELTQNGYEIDSESLGISALLFQKK